MFFISISIFSLLLSFVSIAYCYGTSYTICEVDDDKAIEYANAQKILYMVNKFWVFYTNDNYFRYQTSSNGETWSSYTNIRAFMSGAGMRIATHFDGTYFHYAVSYMNVAIYYRRGIPNIDGTITWSTTEQTVVSASDLYYVTVTVDTDGYPFIGYTRATMTPCYAKVVKSSYNNGTWDTEWTETLVERDGGHHFYTTVRTLKNNRIIVVYTVPAVTPYRMGYIYAQLWNGSDWGSNQTVTTTQGYASRYNCIAEEDNIHLVFNSGGQSENVEIRYVKGVYSAGSHSWSSEVVIDNTATVGLYPTIVRNGTNLYTVWATYPTTGYIYYREYDASKMVWNNKVRWLSDYSTTFAFRTLDGMHYMINDKIGFFWESFDGSKYYLLFADLGESINGVGVTDISSILNEMLPIIITLAVIGMMLSLLEKMSEQLEGKGER